MEDILGTSWPIFVGLTVVLFGGAAFMLGQAVAGTWRPGWQILPYGLMLGIANQFLTFALFQGPFGALVPYLVDTAILTALAALSYRLTKVHKMVTQYPWLYERTGLFSWRAKEQLTA
jgi:branched-chain amino acid transport system ATP-binding protein